MPNFNPFASDVEDTSFEQGMPVGQAAKNATNAVSQQVKQQRDDANKAIMDQLYGSSSSTPQEPGTDEKNVQATDHPPASQVSYAATSGQLGKNPSANPTQSPQDQAKMEKIRRELFGNYSIKFQSAPNGAQNITTNLEAEIEKARQERKQKKMQRKQEEEEEELRKKEEEEAKKQELVMPGGKKTGVMYGKKQQQPLAVRLAATKAESNRGTSG